MLADLWDKVKGMLSRFRSPTDPLAGESDADRLARAPEVEDQEAPTRSDIPEPDVDRWKRSFLERPNLVDDEGQQVNRLRPAPISGASVDRLVGRLQDSDEPVSRNVRIPPELQGQDVAPPPGGFRLTPPQEAAATQVSGQDKPLTERQGDEMITVLREILAKLGEVSDAQENVATALANLASVLPSVGGVIP